jgi:hypothetical protein
MSRSFVGARVLDVQRIRDYSYSDSRVGLPRQRQARNARIRVDNDDWRPVRVTLDALRAATVPALNAAESGT